MDNTAARLAKFKRRVKMIESPEHLAKILASFPKSHHHELRATLKAHGKDHLLK